MIKHPTLDVYCDQDGVLYYRLDGCIDGAGYRQITVPSKKGRSIRIRAHTLVLECKLKRRLKPGEVCRHLNDKKTDNRPDNLEPGTQKQNCQDTVRNGNSTRGKKNPQCVLTEEIVRDIRKRRAGGETGKVLAEEYGITQATVCDIVKRRTWQHI